MELIDSSSKAHLILRCHSYKMFQAIFRRLVIGLKLYLSLPTDLMWSAHQAEKWALFFNQRNDQNMTSTSLVAGKGKAHKSSKLPSSGILSQMKMLIASSANGSSEEKMSILDGHLSEQFSSMAVIEGNNQLVSARNTLLQAAESLEQALSSLDLPPIFPNAGVVEQHVRELRSLNKANHLLYSELLTMQVSIFGCLSHSYS